MMLIADQPSRLSESELLLVKGSCHWVKKHKEEITKRFADENIYPSDPEPVSLFMAGTPGAGKTEYSKRLNKELGNTAVRIDADEIREMMRGEGYNGKNSYIFQKACVAAVNNLFAHVLKSGQNVILDGTFAYAHAIENISRSLGARRKVLVYFVYQDPLNAWEVTKAREEEEGRRVFKQNFIDAYFKARENITEAKKEFGSKIELNLIIKEYSSTGKEKSIFNIEQIDGYLDKVYTREELDQLIV